MLEEIFVPIVYNTDSEAVKQFRQRTVAALTKLGWRSNVNMKLRDSRKQVVQVTVMYKGVDSSS